MSWNITVHENSEENKATQQAWGSKKKKGVGVGGRKVWMSVSLGHYIWPFQEPDQLLPLSQILGLTFLGNLLIFTSASYPPSVCFSFFSFKGKSLSEEDFVPNYVCVQLPEQWGAHLRNEQ